MVVLQYAAWRVKYKDFKLEFLVGQFCDLSQTNFKWKKEIHHFDLRYARYH